MRSGTARIIFIAALMSALLLAASPAEAKKHKKPKSPPVSVTSSTQTTTTAGDLTNVIATCPHGFAVGGGFAAPPSVSGSNVSGIYFVFESRPISERSWKVSAIREDTTGPAPLTSFVDCRSGKLPGKKKNKKNKKKNKKLKIVESTGTGTAAGNSEGNATAVCPPKTQALTGGFSSSPNPALGGSSAIPLFAKSYRSAPNAWTSDLFNIGGTTRTVTTYAYCASGLKITDSVGIAPLPGSSSSGIGNATASSPSCPPKLALLGGGFNNTVPSSTTAVAIINTAQPVGGTFQVSALNDSMSPGTLESHGYCA